MPRKKKKFSKKPVQKKSTKKKKSKVTKKRQPRLKKPTKKQSKTARKTNIFWPGGIFLVLLVSASFVFLKQQVKNSPQLASAPIKHLIASISAQKDWIKIDPEFSYTEEQPKKESPIRIVIPSLKIDASVAEAQVIDGYWETATNSASFGMGSAYPEEIGNTVIFAHARQGLFASLGFLQKDAMVYLFTPSKWFAYKVKEVKTVLPNQVEVVSPTKDKTLTLYTCSGYRDAYRLVVIAMPID